MRDKTFIKIFSWHMRMFLDASAKKISFFCVNEWKLTRVDYPWQHLGYFSKRRFIGNKKSCSTVVSCKSYNRVRESILLIGLLVPVLYAVNLSMGYLKSRVLTKLYRSCFMSQYLNGGYQNIFLLCLNYIVYLNISPYSVQMRENTDQRNFSDLTRPLINAD